MVIDLIYSNVCETIGNTPIVRLRKLENKYTIKNELYVKIEKVNPAGSIKDRVAYNMIKSAYENKIINKDTVIVEATSGNTGIGLAMVCAYYGLKLIIVMPKGVTKERIKILEEYGVKVILTVKKKGIIGSIEKAKQICKENPNSYYIDQFSNKMNVQVHYEKTAKEIIDDFGSDIDMVFVGMGSCGTITGIGKKIKEVNKEIKVIGVEPETNPFYSKGKCGKYDIPGIGGMFYPNILNKIYIDEITLVSDEEARIWKKELSKEEGLLVGISSGAVLSAVINYVKEKKIINKKIVVIFPDGGERYLSL